MSQITLIESPDVPTVGVGEGTWPTMRETLDKIGVSETDLFRECEASFADAVSFQGHLCERGLAPKQITTPEYASVVNYAYHLNAPKLGEFLRKHSIDQKNGDISGDLFIDCTGLKSMLLGQHFGIPFASKNVGFVY